MRKRMGKAAVSLVLAAAMAVWTPPAGGASLAASGGTASEGNLGGVSFSGTASEGNREGAVSGGTSMEGELPEEDMPKFCRWIRLIFILQVIFMPSLPLTI
nr:hypothetical protein [uncultured Acetatifactor sp.]